MNQSRQVINELSTMKKPHFREGDKVRFSGGSIHGRYTGTIRQIFKNSKASVVAKVRGVDKTFHPDFDDMTLVTEAMMDCPTCDGTGKVDGKTCTTCDGTGEVESDMEDSGEPGEE